MSKDPQEGSIEQAVARLTAEPEVETPAPPTLEPDAAPEAPEEPVAQVEDEEHEETETEEPEEEEGETPTEDDEGDTEYEEETEDEEAPTEGEEPEETFYKVTIDGEEMEVNLDELTGGYQRQKDYTKKTQAVSDQRKMLETKQAEITAVQEDFMSKAQMANELLNRDLAKYAAVDWEALKANDPAAFLTKQIEIQDIKADQVKLQEAYQQSQELAEKTRQEARQTLLAEEHPKVLAAFPEWIDNEKAQEHWQKLSKYAESVQLDIAHMVTARDITILDKARKYDEIQQTKKGIKRKSKPQTRKVVKPKGVAPKHTGSKKRMAEKKGDLRASGSIEAAAALLMERRMQKSKQ